MNTLIIPIFSSVKTAKAAIASMICTGRRVGKIGINPPFFMRRQETADLVQAIGSANSQSAAVKTINGGLKRGTYVCKELVYAYAMWVSPEFHREVAHAFETHS